MRDADGQHECDPIVPAENGVSGGMDRDRGATTPEPGGYARGAATGHVAGNAVAAPALGAESTLCRPPRSRRWGFHTPPGNAPRHHDAGVSPAPVIWGRVPASTATTGAD